MTDHNIRQPEHVRSNDAQPELPHNLNTPPGTLPAGQWMFVPNNYTIVPASSTSPSLPASHPAPGAPFSLPSAIAGDYHTPPQSFIAPPPAGYPTSYPSPSSPPPAPQVPPHHHEDSQYGQLSMPNPQSHDPGSEPPAYEESAGTSSAPREIQKDSEAKYVWYLGAQILDPALDKSSSMGTAPLADFNAERYLEDLMTIATDKDKNKDQPPAELRAGMLFSSLTIPERDALNDCSLAKTGRDLVGYVDRYFSSDSKKVLRGLAQGPLSYDVHLLKNELENAIYAETVLIELLLDRPQEELKLLISEFRKRSEKSLLETVKENTYGKLERLFVMALSNQRTPDSAPVDPNQLDKDIANLHRAAAAREELPFMEVFVNRSRPHLAQVISKYAEKHHTSLSKVIKNTFSSYLKKALLYILHGVKPKRTKHGQGVWRDMKLIEKTMAGLGTSNTKLIYRTIRAHWNLQRFDAIKAAYLERYGRTLESRVRGDTSGTYRTLMLDILARNEKKQ